MYSGKTTNSKIKITAILLTLLSTLSIMLLYSPWSGDASKKILWIPVTFVMYYLVNSVLQNEEKRQKRVVLFLSILFAAFTVVGKSIHEDLSLEKYTYGITGLVKLFMTISGMVVVFYTSLCWLLERISNVQWGSFDIFERIKPGKRMFCIMWGSIFILWLPYFVVYFPGILAVDSLIQLSQAIGLVEMTGHHPLISTLLIFLTVNSGKLIGSLTLGVALYSLIQMLIMSAIFSFTIIYLFHIKVNKVICFIVFILFALLPVNALYSVTMWKDVLFGGIVLLTFIAAFELIRMPDNIFGNSWRITGLIVLLFFFCLFRNNGYYAFILFIPVLFAAFKKYFMKVVIVIITMLLLVNSFNYITFSMMNIKKGMVRESLSLPLQQLARVVREYHDELNSEELGIIGEILPVDSLSSLYNPRLADPVKSRFDNDMFLAQPDRYLKLWFKLGMRYPISYIESFLCSNYGYWFPDVDYWKAYDSIDSIEGVSIDVRQIEAFSSLRKAFSYADVLLMIPPFYLLYSIGLMVWMIILSTGMLLVINKRRYIIAVVLPMCVWLTTLASPVHAEYRYVYGLMLVAPVFFGIVTDMYIKEKDCSSSDGEIR